MGRTALTVLPLSGPYPNPLTLDALTWEAFDVVNDNDFVLTGREIILIRNDDVGAQLVTLESIASDKGRTGDVTLTVAAAAYAMYQASSLGGWLQAGGKFFLKAADADVKVAIVQYK